MYKPANTPKPRFYGLNAVSQRFNAYKPPDQTVTCLTVVDMPSFEEIFENTQNTTRHIPKSCRVKFAEALSQVCDKILNLFIEIEGHKLLLMLPTCCLRSPVRSGQRKQIAIANWHAKVLKRCLDGDNRGLWAESKQKCITR